MVLKGTYERTSRAALPADKGPELGATHQNLCKRLRSDILRSHLRDIRSRAAMVRAAAEKHQLTAVYEQLLREYFVAKEAIYQIKNLETMVLKLLSKGQKDKMAQLFTQIEEAYETLKKETDIEKEEDQKIKGTFDKVKSFYLK